jgi:hypothetical protein
VSAFEDAVIQRIKQLEREVERLQRWERPIGGEGKADDTAVVHKSGDESVGGIKTFTSFPVTPSSAPTSDYQAANKKYVDDNAGSGGVTDHGWLTGLLDNDHPQYLLTTGKASDSDKLDGVDSTGYVNTSSSQTVDGVKSFIKNILSNSILPLLPETYDIGGDTYRYRKGYFSELSSLIFSKENIVVLDGQFLVTKMAGTLPATVTATDLEIDFGRAMFSGDFVLFRSEGQMEYMKVGSIVSGTTYQVTRNLDGSGANVWPEGVPFAVLGSAGEGWIELNALDKRRISIWAQGSAYNNSLEIARYGEITGWQNAGFSGVGLAFGDFANNKYFVSTDVDGMMAAGLSLKIGSGEKDVDLTGVQIDDTEIVGQADGVDQVVIGVDGKLKAGGGDIVLGENGIILNAPSDSGVYDSKKSLNFMMMDTDTLVGYLSGYKGGVDEAYANILRMWAIGCSPAYRSTLILTSYNGDASNQKISIITLQSTSTNTSIVFTADSSLAIGNFNVTNGGLHVGSTIDPGDNNLVVDGTIKDGNGVEYSKSTHNHTGTYLPINGKAADSDKLDGYDSTSFGRPVFLTTPKTSTDWDGDTKTTSNRAIVDLSTVFGVPAGIKAVLMSIQTQADAVNEYIRFGPNSTYNYALICRTPVASQIAHAMGIVPCDSNGDVYCYPSGTIENVYVYIWGYWL